jgi:hypothetical protein
MTKMVEQAIEALKDLPEDRQTTAARAILDDASHDDAPTTSPTMSAWSCARASLERGHLGSKGLYGVRIGAALGSSCQKLPDRRFENCQENVLPWDG